jgi:hypothetical protein
MRDAGKGLKSFNVRMHELKGVSEKSEPGREV